MDRGPLDIREAIIQALDQSRENLSGCAHDMDERLDSIVPYLLVLVAGAYEERGNRLAGIDTDARQCVKARMRVGVGVANGHIGQRGCRGLADLDQCFSRIVGGRRI